LKEKGRKNYRVETKGQNKMSEAVAGMAWSAIAKSAYKAYSASTRNKNYQGLPMPEWEQLSQSIQTAWEVAVRQAGECFGLIGGTLPPDEQNWAGWVPPQFR
jgi:hypothetical protein